MLDDRICWTLTPGAVAFRKQTRGIAQALDIPFIEKKVKRTKAWSWLPNKWHLNALKQIAHGYEPLRPPWPDLVISSGSCTIPYALAIKKASGGKTAIVHVQKPTIACKHFDAVVAPEHDRAKNKRSKNVLETFGATHDISASELNVAAKRFRQQYPKFKAPFLSIFLGGSSKKYDFTPQYAAELANQILAIAKEYPGTLLISGSRRTGDENLAYMAQRFKDYPNIYFYQNIGTNPYHAMLGLADCLMVTDDSVSMISEACYTGKPVYLLRLPRQQQRKKIQQFIDQAVKRGLIRYYENDLSAWDKKPLNETQRIATDLKQILQPVLTL